MKKVRTKLYINLKNILHNSEAIRKRLLVDTKYMIVVKADAYGHGAIEVCKHLSDVIDYLAVASIEEAISLRKENIDKPILILGYTMKDNYSDLLDFKIEQTIYSWEDAICLERVAEKYSKKAVIHIAVDTGMGRIGFLPTDENVSQIKKIVQLPNLELKGIFTHFATADEEDKTYTKEQADKFNCFIQALEEQGIFFEIKHMCNSAGIIDFPQYCTDMVRAGIILYGLYPSNDVNQNDIKLKPALEWKAHVVYVKEVPRGTSISYGRTYITSKDVTKIATINVGYGDGYPRALSNKGRVLIRGKSVPIVGRICMDQFMVDVSELDQIEVEDVVTLIGRDGDEFISVEEMAELTGKVNYEFICDIGKRVPREYIR